MKKKLFLYSAIVVNLALLFFTKCTMNVENGGTEVGNPNILAMLYSPNGTPAKHATVWFYKFGVDPRTGLAKTAAAPVDSTTTDTNGNYTAKLDTGIYNILANGGGNSTFQDSITVVKDSLVKPPSDTLKAPGGIKGIVQLEAGGDPTTVFVLFMGANVFTTVQDAAGNFATTGMAKGKYQVKFLSTLGNYKPKDTVLSVTAGIVDSLPGPIVLQYTGIPVPIGLRIVYDTLKQIVTLTWNKADTALVKSYNVYRRNIDSNTVAVRINASPVADTVYRDSTGVQGTTYEYMVSAVNKSTTEGTKSTTISVMIASAFALLDSINLKTSTVDAFRFTIAKDSSIFVAFRTAGYIGVFSSKGDSIKSIGKGLFSQLYGIVLDSKENIYAIDPDQNKIVKFNQNGDTLFQKTIQNPTTITIDKNDIIYVGYSNEGQIARLDTSGNKIDSLTLPAGGKCRYLVPTNKGDLLVGNAGTVTIDEYDSNLILKQSATFKNNLQNIYTIRAVDSNENWFFEVEYTVNMIVYKQINVYNVSGNFAAKMIPNLYFSDICISQNKIYLVDEFGNIKIFKALF